MIKILWGICDKGGIMVNNISFGLNPHKTINIVADTG